MAKKKNENTPSAIAVIYARYSSHSQKDISIEQQIAECMEYAATNNLEVVETYEDRHLTGRSDKRPGFQRMMRHAEKRRFQVIISWKSNRMARNMLHALQYEDRLAKFGVRVVYAKEEFGDNAAGRFALRTMMNVNQFYSENMAEDIKRGLYDNAENCKINSGVLPYGYRRGEDGKYAIDEDKANIVREIFSRVACGDSFTEIARDLNSRGIKTGTGNEWGRSSFHRMMKNERYMGIYIYGKVRIEGGMPQIIGEELYHTVQEQLKSKKKSGRRRRTNTDYLLTGKLYCGKCGSHMVGISGTSKQGKLHYYYICQARNLEKTCDKEYVRKDWVEEQIANAIKTYILQDEVIEWIADSVCEYSKKQRRKSQVAILEKQLAENKKATKNLLNAIEQGIVTVTTKERLLELETEQSKISGLLAVERASVLAVDKEDIIVWLESFRNGDISNKKVQEKLFNTFLVSAYLYDDELKLIFNFTGQESSISVGLNAPDSQKSDELSEESSYNAPLVVPRGIEPLIPA